VKLRSMLAVPTVVILLITVLLVGVLAVGSLRTWRRADIAVARLEQLRQLLLLQEMVGLERAPTNTALSLHGPMSADDVAALAAARGATDQRLRRLAGLPTLTTDARAMLPVLSDDMADARGRIDVVLAHPAGQRTAADVEAAVKSLLVLPPLFAPVVETTLADIASADHDTAPLLSATRAVADLRLYAGTMVGWFTMALTAQRPFTTVEIAQIRVQQGQMIELHRLLLANIRIAGVTAATQAAIDTMERRVFVDAQRLYDRVVASGVGDGRFDLTHAAVVAEYMPALSSLVAVRDRLIDLTRQRLETDQRTRLRGLEMTVAIGCIELLAVLAALATLHWRVIRPLSALAAMVIRLAQGDRSVRLPVRHGSREVAELARAIEVLRAATLAADAEAARRHTELQRWTDQLHVVLATIDLLHDRTATMTDLLPTLLAQLDALAAQAGTSAPGLAEAIEATRAGIAVLRASSGRLDAALRRMHAVSDGADSRIEDLRGAMDEVADVVATIEASVNNLPRITLSAVRDMPRPAAKGPGHGVLDQILAQVQEMAAASGGLQTALLRAHQGIGELSRLRA
jgi:methyl-accepting chemotaxis protein